MRYRDSYRDYIGTTAGIHEGASYRDYYGEYMETTVEIHSLIPTKH